ncbi:MAG: hypothetical protein DMG50_05375 [Acidobacteria bacterium]|nr:MAG: hypothetical protein DMG50_05375 [Acidobacteriota bacterium]
MHLLRFTKRRQSLLADAGYLSKGMEVLGTAAQSTIRRRARNLATPVRQ